MRHRLTARAAAWALLLPLGACATAAPTTRPDVAVPSTFATAAGEAALPDQWWRALGDPALDRLVARGLASNPGLLATWARLDQANASARRTRADGALTLDGSAGAGAGVRSGEDAQANLSVGLAARYELDLWGRLGASREAATLSARASELDLRAAAVTLSAEIAVAYLQLVEQQAAHALLVRQLELAEGTLDLVRQRFEHGLVARVDLLQQQRLVESLRGELVQSEEQTARASHRLAVLVGAPPATALGVTASGFATLPALPAAGVPAELLQRRPDVRAAMLRVAAADQDVAAALAARYPRLSLSASATTSGTSPAGLLEGWALSLVGNLVAPILDAGQRAADVERSRAALRERVHDYTETVLAALQDVEGALVGEVKQAAYVASLDRQLELAREVLARVQESYQAGLSDYLQVLDAQESLLGLERQRLAAESRRWQTRVALCRALAGSWTLPRPALAG